jgi:ATP/maltotriose-dependent transcriptional regulator MalT
MKAKTGESTAEFEVTSGITLSRTLIPTLPPNFLSRKHLFSLLENPSPSTTVVLAPAGYGKTSLVAEWAQSQRDRVIWVTLAESDTLEEMSAIFIQATRNILPGFAPWFDEEPGIRPVENVRRWGNELLATGKDFILVIDNLRQHTARDVDIAVKLIEQFPPNLQFVTIRRDSIETVYATFSSRGPLTVVGMNVLAFSNLLPIRFSGLVISCSGPSTS